MYFLMAFNCIYSLILYGNRYATNQTNYDIVTIWCMDLIHVDASSTFCCCDKFLWNIITAVGTISSEKKHFCVVYFLKLFLYVLMVMCDIHDKHLLLIGYARGMVVVVRGS